MGAEPDYIFLLNPPNSGSTAFAKTLLTSPTATALVPNAEGQLHPAVRDVMAPRWDGDAALPWAQIRAAWGQAWRERRGEKPGADVVIEKSPPNLIRAGEIARAFEGARFIVWNRDPYAVISSFASRYGDPVDGTARFWLRCAEALADSLATLTPVLFLTYERFIADQQGAADEILAFAPELGRLDLTTKIRVKNRVSAGFRDFNEAQIAVLEGRDLDAINAVLGPREDLLAKFGYRLRPGGL